jgi:hypothetical protein
MNDCHYAVIRSRELPGVPFEWITLAETMVRALHESESITSTES